MARTAPVSAEFASLDLHRSQSGIVARGNATIEPPAASDPVGFESMGLCFETFQMGKSGRERERRALPTLERRSRHQGLRCEKTKCINVIMHSEKMDYCLESFLNAVSPTRRFSF